MTPAAKPGAGAQDHWEGSPSWGNPYGFEWYELAGRETTPGTETREYANMTLTRQDDHIMESPGDDFVDSVGNPITLRGYRDWIIDRTEIVNRYFSEIDVKYYLYRISGSSPGVTTEIWNIYRYRFLQWMYQRQERRTA